MFSVYLSLKQLTSGVSLGTKGQNWIDLQNSLWHYAIRHYVQEVTVSPQEKPITDQNEYTWGECGQMLGQTVEARGKLIRWNVIVMGRRADEGPWLSVCVDCGQLGKEAHVWPQLPLQKWSYQLSRTYSPSAPNTPWPAVTTLGNFLCCFTVVTSLHLACTTAVLGRGTATCHNPKNMTSGRWSV